MSNEIDKLYDQHVNDPRPQPLIVADAWKFNLAYVEGDGGNWYAVQDWINGLTDGKARRNAWTDMKRQLFVSTEQLPYTATNGKTYQVDYTNEQGLYAIAAHMRGNKKRPVLTAIKAYLVRCGVLIEEIRRDPSKATDLAIALYQKQGKDPKWIEARTEGVVVRWQFTAALQSALGNPQSVHYAMATDVIYRSLWQRTSAQLKQELGLKKNESLRDHQPALALAYQRIAEMVIAEKLGNAETLTWEQAEQIIKQIAPMIGQQAAVTEQILGVDLATGKPLLNKSN